MDTKHRLYMRTVKYTHFLNSTSSFIANINYRAKYGSDTTNYERQRKNLNNQFFSNKLVVWITGPFWLL